MRVPPVASLAFMLPEASRIMPMLRVSCALDSGRDRDDEEGAGERGEAADHDLPSDAVQGGRGSFETSQLWDSITPL